LPEPELGWARNKCIHCGVCLEKCESKALSVNGEDIIKDRNACVQCNTCVTECYPEAHYLIGKSYSAAQICEMVEEDRSIFEISGGGVSISGGEPTVQYPFLKELTEMLHLRGFHVTLQTNIHVPWKIYESILPYIDFFMCDLKLYDAKKHLYWTGKENRTILENIQKLDKTGKPYCVRTPVVPGVNDRKEQLQELSDFVSRLDNIESYELLSFHPLASYKYHNMGMKYAFEEIKEIPTDEFAGLKELFEINKQKQNGHNN
jgi:pyruvate formate lyase activating enzyme